jgi:membrane-associated phospholipid phosphatase
MWNNSLNLAVYNWLAHYTSISPHFNLFIQYLESAYLFKGIPIMGLLLFFWFRDTDPKSNTRKLVIASFVGCLVAVFIARVANHLLPFQPRPSANLALPVLSYAGLLEQETQALFDWSSFPSDHAAMFFSLATGIFLISRSVGVFTFFYIAIFIALPRIYLGLHYPTDILAGAILGVICGVLCTRKRMINLYGNMCMNLLKKYPAAFQTALFIFSVEVCVMFNDIRRILSFMKVLY